VTGSAQNPLTLNRFLYANANPATLVDPDGHNAYYESAANPTSEDYRKYREKRDADAESKFMHRRSMLTNKEERAWLQLAKKAAGLRPGRENADDVAVGIVSRKFFESMSPQEQYAYAMAHGEECLEYLLNSPEDTLANPQVFMTYEMYATETWRSQVLAWQASGSNPDTQPGVFSAPQLGWFYTFDQIATAYEKERDNGSAVNYWTGGIAAFIGSMGDHPAGGGESGSPGMLGANGQQMDGSKTLLNAKGFHVDVENPAPGVRPGQLHVQFGKDKYIYDFNTNTWVPRPGSPPLTNRQLVDLNSPEVNKAIAKGRTYLGLPGQP
jgi:hypothetical protein